MTRDELHDIVKRLQDMQEAWAEAIEWLDRGEFSDGGLSAMRAEQHDTLRRAADTITALLAERDALRDALTFVRRGIESGHIEFSPIVLDQSGCFKQERRRLADVVNAALGEGNE